MILLHVKDATDLSIYRYAIANTDLGKCTYTYENITIAVNQHINRVYRTTPYSELELESSGSYDITDVEFTDARETKEAIYSKYPELLL